MKECSRCGIVKENKDFYKDKRQPTGLYSACKKCHNKYTTGYLKTPKGKEYQQNYFKKYGIGYRKKYFLTPNGRLARIKYHAVQRKIKFNLSLSDYLPFWGKPCFYCGVEMKSTGLDRLNNDIGYQPGNITACCWQCNRKKHQKTLKEFLAIIKL